jgi:hypothetical protein
LSESRITIKFKVGGIELQLEGPRQLILDMIENDLPKVFDSLAKITAEKQPPQPPTPIGQVTATPQPTPSAPSPLEPETFPSISAESCADAIVALLSTDWGRRKPRPLSEIMAALEANALHYSRRVIGFTLTRLTRRQKVRRWKAKEGFIYTI